MTEWEKKITVDVINALRNYYTTEDIVNIIKREIIIFSELFGNEISPGFCDCSMIIECELEKRGINI